MLSFFIASWNLKHSSFSWIVRCINFNNADLISSQFCLSRCCLISWKLESLMGSQQFLLKLGIGWRVQLNKTLQVMSVSEGTMYDVSRLSVRSLCVTCWSVISAENLTLPYLSAYLDSIGSNFSHGANFATAGSTIRPQNTTKSQSGFSPISLDVQSVQFSDFYSRSQIARQKGMQDVANCATSTVIANYLSNITILVLFRLHRSCISKPVTRKGWFFSCIVHLWHWPKWSHCWLQA